jgi:hypothetical protein
VRTASNCVYIYPPVISALLPENITFRTFIDLFFQFHSFVDKKLMSPCTYYDRIYSVFKEPVRSSNHLALNGWKKVSGRVLRIVFFF